MDREKMIAIHPKTKEAYELFHRGTLAFARAERAGIRVDTEYCVKKKEELTKQINKLEKEIKDSKFGRHWQHVTKKIDLNSNYQLAHFLYDVKKLKPMKLTTTGKGSTDNETLSALEIPEVDKLLKVRKLKKIRDTYLDAYLREQVRGFIHPFFNLNLVRTFRSSSDHPNFQNIPKRDKEAMAICRKALYPRRGHQFLAGDFSGIEVRMAVVYTEDEKLHYDVVHGDMHRDMAMELYMLDELDKHDSGESAFRQGGKNGFVFPEFYGDYYGNCAPNLLKWAKQAKRRDGTPGLVHLQDKGLIRLDRKGNIRNSDKFTEHVKKVEDRFWNERYRTYTRWKRKTWARYQRKGYVDMYTGFRCSGLMSKKDVTNYPFQGTAFHCLLWTFIEVDQRMQERKSNSRLVSQVHDELTSDTAPEELTQVAKTIRQVATKELPEAWQWLKAVPLDIELEVGGVDESLADIKYYEEGN